MKLAYTFLVACLITTASLYAAQLETDRPALIERLKTLSSEEQKQLTALAQILQKLIDNQEKHDKQIAILHEENKLYLYTSNLAISTGIASAIYASNKRTSTIPFLTSSLFHLWQVFQQLEIINKLESELANNSQPPSQKPINQKEQPLTKEI